MRPRTAAALLLVIALAMGGCASDAPPKQARGGDITVFAASSLTQAFTRLAAIYERQHPGWSVHLNFAASDTLATQVTQGAIVDVFASAAADPMKTVTRSALLSDRPQLFATNRLVIITTRNPGSAPIRNPTDLAHPDIKLVLAAPGVPAGDYAREILDKLGIRQPAEKNIVSNEVDDKGVVSKVLLGDADAGIVYVTDLTPDVRSKLDVVRIPKQDNVPARYPIIALKNGAQQYSGRRFVRLVMSSKGQRILRGFGFGPP
jgi:molybdate transport system substrate-binding protein